MFIATAFGLFLILAAFAALYLTISRSDTFREAPEIVLRSITQSIHKLHIQIIGLSAVVAAFIFLIYVAFPIQHLPNAVRSIEVGAVLAISVVFGSGVTVVSHRITFKFLKDTFSSIPMLTQNAIMFVRAPMQKSFTHACILVAFHFVGVVACFSLVLIHSGFNSLLVEVAAIELFPWIVGAYTAGTALAGFLIHLHGVGYNPTLLHIFLSRNRATNDSPASILHMGTQFAEWVRSSAIVVAQFTFVPAILCIMIHVGSVFCKANPTHPGHAMILLFPMFTLAFGVWSTGIASAVVRAEETDSVMRMIERNFGVVLVLASTSLLGLLKWALGLPWRWLSIAVLVAGLAVLTVFYCIVWYRRSDQRIANHEIVDMRQIQKRIWVTVLPIVLFGMGALGGSICGLQTEMPRGALLGASVIVWLLLALSPWLLAMRSMASLIAVARKSPVQLLDESDMASNVPQAFGILENFAQQFSMRVVSLHWSVGVVVLVTALWSDAGTTRTPWQWGSAGFAIVVVFLLANQILQGVLHVSKRFGARIQTGWTQANIGLDWQHLPAPLALTALIPVIFVVALQIFGKSDKGVLLSYSVGAFLLAATIATEIGVNIALLASGSSDSESASLDASQFERADAAPVTGSFGDFIGSGVGLVLHEAIVLVTAILSVFWLFFT